MQIETKISNSASSVEPTDYELILKKGVGRKPKIESDSQLHIQENCLIIHDIFGDITDIIPLHNILYVKKR